ncbi:MAG TPA: transposase [Oligoflexia bacterium]|nr:transposase [Oligoflexia bacterium]HMP47316.1 transposase [Oligoflexia bacterium]
MIYSLHEPEVVCYSKGKAHQGVQILHPKSSTKDITEKEVKTRKRKIKRRSAIEPIISHLKSNHRMQRNFLKGVFGDAINLLMPASGFNFRKWIRKILFCIIQWHIWNSLYSFYVKKIACI